MSEKGATVLSETNAKIHSENHRLLLKKRLSLEAQRVLSILETCISRVEIAAALPAALRLNSESSVVDKELSRALREHQILVERLETLEGLKQESDGEQEGEARKRARAQLEKDIKNSVRDLLRLVRGHPDAIFSLRAELGMEEGESESVLIRVLQQFHSNMIEKLLTSLDDELQLAKLSKQVISDPAYHLEEIALQEKEVAESLKTVDTEMYVLNNAIEKMQSSLQGKNLQDADKSLLAEKQCQSHIKTSKVTQASTQQKIDQLNIQLNSLILENRQTERVLQEKIEKVEIEIECLLQHFDDEIKEKQDKLELNEVHYEREEKEVRKLEKPFSILEVECNQILERRRLAEEKRKEEMRDLELKTKAAIMAQAWWRGFSTRKALKNKDKGKKGKKGKGKKTK
ncbi:dynein regulatory complex protein 10 isoform X2 [Dicentrarchus labrax]|uniref:Dynein regulatory complex protein 10 n=2 Tax=Dicentrarchus labrax TaxID=13489 RepID=A0A8C4HFN5_DICLA|nr:dynein regulatory complex protein 10 isoform X2 [Dicentrarchus labrax]